MSLELRQHLEKIITLTDEEFDYVLSHFRVKKLKKHQFLIQNGSSLVDDHFVVKGLLRAYATNADGKEHILQFAMEDWWVSDYQAYFNESKATINIDCLENCDLLSLSLENREKLCDELPQISKFFRLKSNHGYIALQRRILSLLDHDAKGRYEEFLQLYPTLLQRIPKTILANYLGVSRETLSRL